MHKLFLFFLLSLSITMTACYEKLSESKADEIIKEHVHLPDTNFIDIQYGLIAFDRDSLPSYYYILRDKDMFTIEHLGAHGF